MIPVKERPLALVSIGLLGVAALVMLVQIVAVRVGLRPVRVMADEVLELEAGKRTQLSGDYPHELTGLANNLDRFIEHETASRARHRNALDDLAHSLKTPLAVIRNALRGSSSERGPMCPKRQGMAHAVFHGNHLMKHKAGENADTPLSTAGR